MGGTRRDVVPKVSFAGELGLADDGVALGARIGLGGADDDGEDVGLAVLGGGTLSREDKKGGRW